MLPMRALSRGRVRTRHKFGRIQIIEPEGFL